MSNKLAVGVTVGSLGFDNRGAALKLDTVSYDLEASCSLCKAIYVRKRSERTRDSEPTTEPVPPKQGLLNWRPVKLDSPSTPGYHSNRSERTVQTVPKRCSWGYMYGAVIFLEIPK